MKKLDFILLVTGILVSGLVFASGCAGFAGSKNTASDSSGDMAGISPSFMDKDPAVSAGDTGTEGTEETWDLSLSYKETENLKINCDKSDEVERVVNRDDQEKTIAITINTPVKLLHTVDYGDQHWYRAADMDPAQEIAAAARYSVVDRTRYYVYLRGDLYTNSYEMDYTESALLDSLGITVDLGPEETSGFVQLHGDAEVTREGNGRNFQYPDGWNSFEPINEKNVLPLLAACTAGPGAAKKDSRYTVNESGFFLSCAEKTTSNFDDCTTNRIERQMVATFTPHAKKSLRAIPGGPYTALRGVPLHLDASRSTGPITQYSWTFRPGAGCPAGLSFDGIRLAGSSQTATFLCPVMATLTVTDGKDTDSSSVPIAVTPRSWETQFSTSEEGIDTSSMSTAPWFNNPSGGGYEGGANICGLCEGTADENTNFHPPAQGGSWEPSGGYTIAQVTEPGRPFNGYWYISEYVMEMNRKTVINPYILPLASGGRELAYSMGSFYQHNIDNGYDAAGYLAGVRMHEQDHTDRMRRALMSADPAEEIEKMVEKDKDTIQDSVDRKLQDTEKLICRQSSDASQPMMAVTWTGKLLFPTSDTNQWKEGETSVGGYRQDPGESCG